ncbi:hypothetical protein PsYK624_090970 [Phanerochaete sordida]|uniref:polynucleotide adenylyltransferase n=1 Tax=Phanerochaete sordida TaxID=48140 RepID=A0A9P3LFQ7_9APHY|nr:hypothetical protein PsYK624_090970 [Phanerochaete sordida]
MAAVYSPTLSNVHHSQPSRQLHAVQTSPPRRSHISRAQFAAELTQCLVEFVVQLLPTQDELSIKEDVRKLLERLIRTIEPDSRLLSFGSTANGFSLRNSDMDLCCLIDSEDRLPATDLVNMLGDLFARETKFHIKPLPHARIPIVKLSLDPQPGLPYGIACDIGFENRLALENTRLLMCYAMIDPMRVRTLVLFLKVWCKRRKINSPYKGTLSSYGYVLLVIYFLVHVKNPPVLPNLQQIPPLRPISQDETHINGFNVWFFDDVNLLRQRWQSQNTESVAELLIDFFKFYSRDFAYNTGVASIRAGLLTKESKGWDNDPDKGTARERNRLCIEDPFETNFNVSRCVTRDGLYTIRGEFMRASRILAARPDRAFVALAQLCEERKDEELLHASPSRSSFAPPKLPSVPKAAQTPYTIGSNPMRPTGAPEPDRLSPPEVHQIPSAPSPLPATYPAARPAHMAPKRAKWTSPPPPEASEEDQLAFEESLGQGLSLATVSTHAREADHETASSSNNSEIFTDEEDHRSVADSDDVASIRSFTEGARYHRPVVYSAQTSPQAPAYVVDPSSSRGGLRYPASLHDGNSDQRLLNRLRGRPSARPLHYVPENGDGFRAQARPRQETGFVPPPRMDTGTPRRATSGPARPLQSNRYSMSALPAVVTPLSVYPTRAQAISQQPVQQRSNIFYETSSPIRDRMVRALSSTYAMPVARLPTYGKLDGLSPGAEPMSPQFEGTLPSSPRHLRPVTEHQLGPTPPLSTTPSQSYVQSPRTTQSSHSHSLSQSTIVPSTPPSAVHHLPTAALSRRRPSGSRASSGSVDRPGYSPTAASHLHDPSFQHLRSSSPFASVSSTSGSPAMSYTSSQYAASVSPMSTSPPSPSQSDVVATPAVESAAPQFERSASNKAGQSPLPPVQEQPRIAVVDLDPRNDLVHATESLSLEP